jgi:redox-sensing transcriptional repressor
MMTVPSEKTIERLSLYRYILAGLHSERSRNIFSHELAALATTSAAQVRQDLMVLGYSGSPNQGYEVEKLIQSINEFLDVPGKRYIALVGVGNLGQAILSNYVDGRSKLQIVAAFDVDWQLVNRMVSGCWCYPADRLAEVVGKQGITLGIIATPPSAAQPVADRLVEAGVRGILNFAPVRVRVPESVFASHLNITVALEKVCYFAHREPMRVETPSTEEAKV